MATYKKTLIIPIEIKSRELIYKLLLACYAINKNYRVLIGESKYFRQNFFNFPKGIVIENNVVKKKYNFLKKIHSLGFKIIALDDECIMPILFKNYFRLRIYNKNFDLLEYFFTTGILDHQEINKNIPQYNKHKILKVGVPRFNIFDKVYYKDFIKPNKKKKKTIIFISRFSMANPTGKGFGQLQVSWAQRHNLEKNLDLKEDIDSWLNISFKSFKLFSDLLINSAQIFPDINFIIRPHPGEDPTYWEKIILGKQNIKISINNDLIYDIYSSDLVIQNECTTGIESALLGKKVINYVPIKNLFENEVLSKVSKIIRSNKEFYKFIEQYKFDDDINKVSINSRGILKKYYFNLDDHYKIYKTIIEKLDKIILNDKKLFKYTKLRLYYNLKYFYTFLQRVFSFKKYEDKMLNTRRKFPNTTNEEIRDIIKRYHLNNIKVKNYKSKWWEIISE